MIAFCNKCLRGSQYCSHDYQKILRQHGFKVSMSGAGNCYDNAAVETFFKTIKAELLWQRSWRTRRDAEMAIFEYINDEVDAPPGGIAMCQNDRGLNCHEKGEHPWKMLA